MSEIYDLIIIGGGPAGMAAAIYAGRSERKTLLLEKSGYGGRAKDTLEIRNYPGTLSDSGQGLMEKFHAHAENFPSVKFKHSTVTGIRKEDDLFIIETKRKGGLMARSVILALGTRPRELGIPGEKEFVGHGVAYCATCDAEFFKGKNIYVLGAGDQAVEEADYLTKFAEKVTIIVLHEKGHLDCNEISAERAYKNPKIDFVWSTTVQEVKGSDHVESLVLKNVVTNEVNEVPADGLFFFVGMVPQTDLVKDLVTCDRSGYIQVNGKMETSLPGMYAVGDCIQTFLRQIVTSAADGAVAATASERYVKEQEQLSEILGPDSGAVAFVFYNPYQSAEIECVSGLEKKLGGQWKVYRQDISRQDLLYRKLNLDRTVCAAFYKDGKLLEIKSAEDI
ncbi:MAG: FAD-dependent oxidoreductase [Faecalicatena sp.]|uniref:NAD(P)/FAD-dependent oxidoreductase n=1 Tax=Faecalicatena sp. TaxID=2005360 RepID=UPI0025898273|nr:FAD-dependent oxidoreductase [Faecalicatena sp.]MCI6467779.1 FAD-dependent oxidoreductase [Faecalicatena sp.]MDY5619579.1 FAD-dependent oxidoreductase [Lachnospiraceae bacterium]